MQSRIQNSGLKAISANVETARPTWNRTVGILSWISFFAGIGVAIRILLPLPGFGKPTLSSAPDLVLASQPDTALLHPGVALRKIEDLRVGDRVFAANPEIGDQERGRWDEPDWQNWRRAVLEMTKPDGGVLEIDMIRPAEWFVFHRVRSGTEIFLDLPEMGAEGLARVVSVRASPKINAGRGQVITATFAHPPSTDVLDVRFSGESEPLGVTDNHLFWSESREKFVPIGKMFVGELALTYSGARKRIEGMEPRAAPERVYNIEVYGEHVYFVGVAGVLAHNAYTGKADDLGNGLELRTYKIKSSRTGNYYYRKVIFDTTTGKADFSRFAYRGKGGAPVVETFQYTGSRLKDFKAANIQAGFGKGSYSHPTGYTWHHLDYDNATGLGRMILVKTDVHGAVGHSGGVADFVTAKGKAYVK